MKTAAQRLVQRRGWLVPVKKENMLTLVGTFSPAFTQRYGGESETRRLYDLSLAESDGVWLAGHEAKALFLCGVKLDLDPTIGQCWVFPFDTVHQHPITTLLAARAALELQAKLGLRHVFSFVPEIDTRSMFFAMHVGFSIGNDTLDLPIGPSAMITWSPEKRLASTNAG